MGDELLLELYDAEDVTPEETEGATQALRHELLDLDEVSEVRRAVAGAPPPGSRAVDVATVGALVAVVEPTVAAVSRAVSVVLDWLSHRSAHQAGQQVRITVNGQSIDLAAATAAQQQALVDEFIHASQAQ